MFEGNDSTYVISFKNKHHPPANNNNNNKKNKQTNYFGLYSDIYWPIKWYDERDYFALHFAIRLDDLDLHSSSQLYKKSKPSASIIPEISRGFGWNWVCCHNLLVCWS